MPTHETNRNYHIFFWVALAGIVFYFLMHEQVVDQQFKMIQKNSAKIIKIDSLARAIEQTVIDSLADWRSEIEQRIKRDSVEIRNLRRRNERLEKAYRDLDFTDRPNF